MRSLETHRKPIALSLEDRGAVGFSLSMPIRLKVGRPGIGFNNETAGLCRLDLTIKLDFAEELDKVQNRSDLVKIFWATPSILSVGAALFSRIAPVHSLLLSKL